MKKITLRLEITYRSIKTFFNTFNQMSSLKFSATRKGEVSTLKAPLNMIFKTYKDKKKMESLRKNPKNYEDIRNERCVCEQKPVKIDDFNEGEEKEVKKRVEKRKIKRR